MSALKKLRKSRNLSPKELAKELDIEVKELNKWETTPSLIPPKKLSQLAYRFGLDSDELKEYFEDGSGRLTTNSYYIFASKGTEDGFWGHLGIRLKDQSESLWFPITLGTANRTKNTLLNVNSNEDWLIVETLNNRILAIKPALVSRIYLLDDAQDQLSDDWNIPLDGYMGKPGEFYKALEEYYFELLDCCQDSEFCDSVKQDIETFTDILDLGDEEIYSLIMKTHTHTADGGGIFTIC